MNTMNIQYRQREFFASGATLPVEYRIRQLRSLYRIITIYQDEICRALQEDLGKCWQEAYMTEVGLVLSHITHVLRQIKRWTKPRPVPGELIQFGSKAKVYPQPYGVCLILAPWNYPFQLAIAPVVSAIAAGNCVVMKASEYAPATAELLVKLFNQNFEDRFCRVVTGGADVAKNLVSLHFDYIFFTGSTEVGRQVMAQAANNLTPVTLELGGKSPCIVDSTAQIELAAKRIMWGKLLNSGQTCVAPDYVLAEKEVFQPLLQALCRYPGEFYGEDPLSNPQYPRIVNETHFDRLLSLLDNCTLAAGGASDRERLKIAPAIVRNPSPSHPLMKEEIFGPILPVIEVESVAAAVSFVRERPSPLALYLFTQNRKTEKAVISALSFGGGCVNDTVMHITGSNMPFGGIGDSGMGAYHGKAGFDTFTHYKAILKSSSMMDISLRYPPYGENSKLIKRILR